MAGDWLKMTVDLPEKPEVWQIAGMVGIDADTVVGKLLKVWRWFDAHTEDGNAVGVTYALVDHVSGVTGFGEAMALCGWLSQSGSVLTLPNFGRHNGKTAKNRALTAKRVADCKSKSNAKGNGVSVTDALPREEKRREEVKAKATPAASCDPVSEMISGAVEFMASRGVPERQARSVVGMVRKTVGDDLVAAELLAIAAREGIADPVPWLRQAANKREQVVADAAPKPWDGAL